MHDKSLSGGLGGTQFADKEKEEPIPDLERNNNFDEIIVLAKDREPEEDIIHHPSHYNQGEFEVIDVIEDWELGFNLGNAIKYIARHKAKGNATVDLKKALFYIKREINRELKSCNLPVDFTNVEKTK